jgi:hypothetical protein
LTQTHDERANTYILTGYGQCSTHVSGCCCLKVCVCVCVCVCVYPHRQRPMLDPCQRLQLSQTRLQSVSSKSTLYVKRDLCLCQKRPMYVPKETYVCVKRDLCMCQKRPKSSVSLFKKYSLRPVSVSQATYSSSSIYFAFSKFSLVTCI